MIAMLDVRVARVAAVFASDLQPSDRPGRAEVGKAVSVAVRRFGSAGCKELLAQEFGDHPDTAVRRMKWAGEVVATAYPRPDRKGHLSRSRP